MQALRCRRLVLALSMVFLGAACGGGGGGGGTIPAGGGGGGGVGGTSGGATGGATTWLERLNMFRSWAGLPAVTEDAALATGCVNHSQYMVKNDVIQHSEDPLNPWYTASGSAAAGSCNLHVSSGIPGDLGLGWVGPLNGWMTGPFHGLGMIDPRLTQSAYGQYAEVIGIWQFGAALDVLSHAGGAAGAYPIMWPGNGATIDLRSYGGSESPDPLLGSGYVPPTGPPIYLQVGSGGATISVTASSFSAGGGPLPHITFDETS